MVKAIWNFFCSKKFCMKDTGCSKTFIKVILQSNWNILYNILYYIYKRIACIEQGHTYIPRDVNFVWMSSLKSPFNVRMGKVWSQNRWGEGLNKNIRPPDIRRIILKGKADIRLIFGFSGYSILGPAAKQIGHDFDTRCSINIVFFHSVESLPPLLRHPVLNCYWLNKKLSANRSDSTLALRWEPWKSLTAM